MKQAIVLCLVGLLACGGGKPKQQQPEVELKETEGPDFVEPHELDQKSEDVSSMDSDEDVTLSDDKPDAHDDGDHAASTTAGAMKHTNKKPPPDKDKKKKEKDED